MHVPIADVYKAAPAKLITGFGKIWLSEGLEMHISAEQRCWWSWHTAVTTEWDVSFPQVITHHSSKGKRKWLCVYKDPSLPQHKYWASGSALHTSPASSSAKIISISINGPLRKSPASFTPIILYPLIWLRHMIAFYAGFFSIQRHSNKKLLWGCVCEW